MKFSYCMIPAGDMDDLDAAMITADRLGFDTLTTTDEIWEHDPYGMLTAAAGLTSRIRLSLDVTHVVLRHPALIAQALATLDTRSKGRASAAISIGSTDMVDLFGVPRDHPVARVREAHTIIRQLLDTGTSDFAGDFYRTDRVSTTARPEQEHLPVYCGGMNGPLSFRLAGEVSDGLHEAGAYSLPALQYAAGEFRTAAQAAGRDWRKLDLGGWIGGVIAEDSAAARSAAQFMTAFYMPANPPGLLRRHDIDPADVQPVIDLVNAGDIAGAARRCPPEIAAALTVAGTPEQCAEQIQATFLQAGFNHLIFGLVDGPTVKALTGTDPGGMPPVTEQLTLIARRLIPRLT